MTVGEVYDKFESNNWQNMSYDERLQAVQEVAAVSAMKNGTNVTKVEAEYLEGGAYGYYDGDKIVVNRHILENNEMVYMDKDTGEKFSIEVKDSNIQMMDTVFHEDFHAFQEKCINGEVPQEVLDNLGITQDDINNWAAERTVATYVDPGVDHDLYRISNIEKTAYDAGEKNTKEAFAYIESKHGPDPNMSAYAKETHDNGYQVAHDNAALKYNDEKIDETLEKVQMERFTGQPQDYHNNESKNAVEKVLDESMYNALSNTNSKTNENANVHNNAITSTTENNNANEVAPSAPGVSTGTGVETGAGTGVSNNDNGVAAVVDNAIADNNDNASSIGNDNDNDNDNDNGIDFD